MDDPSKDLLAAIRMLSTDEVSGFAVHHLTGLRNALYSITLMDGDVLDEATALHRFGIALERLHLDVARWRNVKLAEARTGKGKLSIGEISRRTGIERSLSLKLIKKGHVNG